MTLREIALEWARQCHHSAIAEADRRNATLLGHDHSLPQSRLHWANKGRSEMATLIRERLDPGRYVSIGGGVVFLTPTSVVAKPLAPGTPPEAQAIASLLPRSGVMYAGRRETIARLRAGIDAGHAYRVGVAGEVLVFTGWGPKILGVIE